MPQRPTMAVLGASGFIGSSLFRHATAAGIACEPFTRARPFHGAGGELDGRLARCAVVYWLISRIRPAETAEAGADLAEFSRLLDGLAATGYSPRIVVVSSGGTVYDARQPPPYAETSPTRAFNSYGSAMLAMETELRTRWSNHVVVRASNAYGPRQPARGGQGVIAHWLKAIDDDEPISIIGDPQTERDYVFIDDLVDALLRCGTHPDPPRVVNIGSGRGTSLALLADLVRRTTARPVTVERVPARSFDAPSTWLDISLAERTLGWRPRTPLAEGLRRTREWAQQAQVPEVAGSP